MDQKRSELIEDLQYMADYIGSDIVDTAIRKIFRKNNVDELSNRELLKLIQYIREAEF